MAAAVTGTDLLAEWRASSEAALAAARKRLAALQGRRRRPAAEA